MPLPNESWYRLLFEHAMDGVLLTRPDGSIVAANPAACRILGYTEDDLRRVGRSGLLAPDNPNLQAALDERERTGRYRGILNFARRGGAAFPVELTSELFVGEDGRPLCAIVFRDVSAALAAEAAVRDSEARYRTAFRTCPDSMTITDLTDGRYLDVNDGFTATFGWTREEAIGRTSAEIGIWHDIGQRAPFLDAVSTLGEVKNIEARFNTRSGEVVDTLVSARVVNVNGRRCILTVAPDISQKKQVEVELARHRLQLQTLVDARTSELAAARDAAEAANVAKSEFLANVSHELRTPMTSIVGFAQLLRRSSLTDEQQATVDKICAASDHLLLVINDVLDLAKIDAGALVLEQTDFRVSSIIGTVRLLMTDQAQAKGLSMIEDIRPLPAWLRGDPTRIRQALLNLVANAIKFTAAGSVTLRVMAQAAVEEVTGHYVTLRFEVEDTGIGISMDKQARLFESFHQVDTSITRHYGGTGMGLSITRRLAESMGGQVGVCSTLGQGSTFWFTLRCEYGQPARQTGFGDLSPEVEPALLGHAGKRVLVAEDNPVNVELIKTILASAGLQVETAVDGHDAVVRAQEGFDLILMDVQMPKLDGLSATRAIRQLNCHSDTPIIAMTANAFSEDVARCFGAGMNDFVAKPFHVATLYETIDRWLSGAPATPTRRDGR